MNAQHCGLSIAWFNLQNGIRSMQVTKRIKCVGEKIDTKFAEAVNNEIHFTVSHFNAFAKMPC